MSPGAGDVGSWRAAVLGLVMTGGMLLAAWGWWGAALSDVALLWSSDDPVPIAEGVQGLVRLAAATAWTLLTAIMARGTAAVVPWHRRGAAGQISEARLARPAHPLAARVAAALLVLTCTGPSASFAAAAPPTSAVPQGGGGSAAPHTLAGPLTDPGAWSHDDDDEGHLEDSGTERHDAIPMPGWLPADRAPEADVTLLARGTEEDRTVTVRQGDTLWSIAADQLAGSPTVEQVAQAWPRWYAANREVIGPDPDLILPGQQLRPPSLSSEGALP